MAAPQSSTASGAPSGLAFILRALRHRNYRLFFIGQCVSLIGTWMTRIATSWLVYRLTGSEWLLGLVSFAGQIPSGLTAPIAGVLVDRWDRHRLLVITQVLSTIQSFTLAALTLTERIEIWHIVALAMVQGFINACDMPARQAFVVEMVDDRQDLPNAIALNSSMVNVARLLGPSIGGVLIAAVGEGWCFFIDGVSYLAVIGSLLAIHVAPSAVTRKPVGRMLHQLAEGWSYVRSFAPIRKLLLLFAVVSLVGMPYMVLLPVFTDRYLHGGPHLLGLLMAASGVGALTGALLLAARRTVVGLAKYIPLTAGVFGAGLIAFACSRTAWLSVPLMVVTGVTFMVQMAATNTLIQTLVDDEKRGRVMGYFMMAFMGTAPFGSLLAGSAATRIGAPNTLIISGLVSILGAVWFARSLPALRNEIRPIYVQKGILPEIASGLQDATELNVPPEG